MKKNITNIVDSKLIGRVDWHY